MAANKQHVHNNENSNFPEISIKIECVQNNLIRNIFEKWLTDMNVNKNYIWTLT